MLKNKIIVISENGRMNTKYLQHEKPVEELIKIRQRFYPYYEKLKIKREHSSMIVEKMFRNIHLQISKHEDLIKEYVNVMIKREIYDCRVASLPNIIDLSSIDEKTSKLFYTLEECEVNEKRLIAEMHEKIKVPQFTMYPFVFKQLDTLEKKNSARTLLRGYRDEALMLRVLQLKKKLLVKKLDMLIENQHIRSKDIISLKDNIFSEYDCNIHQKERLLNVLNDDIVQLFCETHNMMFFKIETRSNTVSKTAKNQKRRYLYSYIGINNKIGKQRIKKIPKLEMKEDENATS